MEFVLIVSFALIIGFFLGVLVMTLLGGSDEEQVRARDSVHVQEAGAARR